MNALTKFIGGGFIVLLAFIIHSSMEFDKQMAPTIKLRNSVDVTSKRSMLSPNVDNLENFYLPHKDVVSAPIPPAVRNQNKLVLEKSNSIVLRGPVTKKSMSQLSAKLLELSRQLDKNDIIYLVLNTPGGDIFAGSDFIQLAKSIPQRVDTVSIQSISMGFQISQHLGKRYTLNSSIFMSHRAFLRGLSGQLDGELESRLKMYQRKIKYLDYVTAKRVGLSADEYEDKVNPEWWVLGFDSVKAGVADEVVDLVCGESMKGTETIEVMTLFGPLSVTFSDCPLIKFPVRIGLKRSKHLNKKEIKNVIESYTNPSYYYKTQMRK